MQASGSSAHGQLQLFITRRKSGMALGIAQRPTSPVKGSTPTAHFTFYFSVWLVGFAFVFFQDRVSSV